jgi:FkbH-like protein
MKYSEILRINKELGRSMSSNQEVEHIFVLSNVTVYPISDILEYYLRIEDVPVVVGLGNYDNIVQDSMHRTERIVVILWELANMAVDAEILLEGMTADELNEFIKAKCAEVDVVVENLTNVPLVLFSTFSSYPFSADMPGTTSYDTVAAALNQHLSTHVSNQLLLVDLDKIYSRLSLDAALDWRGWYQARSLYSIEFYKMFAKNVRVYVRAVTGKTSKALILDCDNTLWGGIIGERDEGSVDIGPADYPGRVYHYVQRRIQALADRGVLLGMCSKNNYEDVEDAFTEHRGMALQIGDFSAVKVNWAPKSVNVAEISKELNIGDDSFVFLDDSEYELDEVKSKLPDVRTCLVPSKIYNYPAVFRQLETNFFSVASSTEDGSKREQYRSEKQRNEVKAASVSIESFLRSLDLVVLVHSNKSDLVSRMAQMTQKTNQFNMTTRRYTDSEIRKRLAEPSVDMLALSVRDKYGDSGVTAVTILEFKDHVATIDTLLMSCRILGRQIENVLMDEIVNVCRNREAREIQASYSPTKKNGHVDTYYDSMGFQHISTDEAGTKLYRLIVSNYRENTNTFIKVENER